MMWKDPAKTLSQIDFALQPIVNIHTGIAYGFEALLRNWEEAGFTSIQNVFDSACEEGLLAEADKVLRIKAVAKFLETGYGSGAKLFYNLDNRLFGLGALAPESALETLQEYGLPAASFCIEISERHEIQCFDKVGGFLNSFREKHFRVAIDDFGSGYSGFQLLYHSEPDIVKLDRFFIDDIEKDAKKKLFVMNIVNMAHVMGIIVIAEGVESEKEFFTCREIGCDYVQGYLIQRPQTDVSELRSKYENVGALVKSDKRFRENKTVVMSKQLEFIPPVILNEPVLTVLELLRNNKNLSFIPVVDKNDEPLGILRERDLKQYVYSPFGFSLLKNHAYGGSVNGFIKSSLLQRSIPGGKILELYAMEKDAEAILVTENGKYRGILSSRSLLEVLNEKKLIDAIDQNPLSRLPGNNLINEYVSEKLSKRSRDSIFVLL